MAFIRNTGRVPENVKVVLEDGTEAWVRVMPRNKGVTLADGVSIHGGWMVQEGQNVKHFDTEHAPKWHTGGDSVAPAVEATAGTAAGAVPAPAADQSE